MNSSDPPPEYGLIAALKDVAVVLVVIVGSWLVKRISGTLFPDGLPFIETFVVLALQFATIVLVLRVVIRASRLAFHELLTLMDDVTHSQLWRGTNRGIKGIYAIWSGLSRLAREMTAIIDVSMLAVIFYAFSGDQAEIIPPIYLAGVVFLGHVIERTSGGRFRMGKGAWIITALVYLLILTIIVYTFLYPLDIGYASELINQVRTSVWPNMFVLSEHIDIDKKVIIIKLIAGIACLYLWYENTILYHQVKHRAQAAYAAYARLKNRLFRFSNGKTLIAV